jgi:D-alanyl-D-alanine carboxypeptidase-like protein
VHAGTLGVTAVTRQGAAVQLPPAGMQYGLATLAVDAATAPSFYGQAVARALNAGQLVLGATAAGLRGGAQAGDDLDVVGWDGVTRRMRVGYVAPDDLVGYSEITMSTATAAAIGFVRPASVRIWDFRSRDAIDLALFVGLPHVRLDVTHTWDPPDPDATLPSALEKVVLGEFAYTPVGDGNIVQEGAWRSTHIVSASVPILGTVTCNVAIFPALRGALNEVQASGLAGLIDVADSRLGGCFAPREIRSGGGTTGGSISRHSWGGAIDINPSQNPFGGTPHMDSRLVAIFHRWGFAWGGTWSLPDGMHFEYQALPS